MLIELSPHSASTRLALHWLQSGALLHAAVAVQEHRGGAHVRPDTRPPRRRQDCICNDKDFAAKIGEVSATNDVFVELQDIAVDTKAKPNTLTVHQRKIRIMPRAST